MTSVLFDVTHGYGSQIGVSEILEIFGSIASGFACPLKREHERLLHKCFLPLHGVAGSEKYHEQLSFLVMQFIQKDHHLLPAVLTAILRYWPQRSASRQIHFLSEVADIISFAKPAQFQAFYPPLFERISFCIESSHFQVAEYAMGLLNVQTIYSNVFENPKLRKWILPNLLESLQKAKVSWNNTVRQISADIMDFIKSLDIEIYRQHEMRIQLQILDDKSELVKLHNVLNIPPPVLIHKYDEVPQDDVDIEEEERKSADLPLKKNSPRSRCLDIEREA